MNVKEIKRALVLLIFGCMLMLLPYSGSATDFSSTNFTVKDPVIDSGSSSSSSTSFGLGQSISQSVVGKSTSASFQIWSGFQYYFKVTQNTLTATAGDTEVDLAWTVPSTFLGITVSGYEVGTGVVSGSYTFEDVGNVTNFTKTGLTNDTPYFFIIKAYGPGGVFLVYSNEDSATPTGSAPPPGGGGGGGSTTSATFNGIAYPNAAVSLVRDSVLTNTITATSTGSFSFNVSGLAGGTYSFSIYAIDANGTKSENLSFNQAIAPYVATEVNNLFLAPTLRTNFSAIKQGEILVLSGFSAPNVPVTVNASGPTPFTQPVNSDTSGAYSVNINTAQLSKGNYTATSQAKISGTDTPDSTPVAFSVGDQTVTPPPPGTCGRSDLNCDGKVNLIDFSIMLYYWDSTSFARNPRVDIDKSGRVGLRDLSIMLYDWTG